MPVFKERSDLPIAYVIAGSSGGGLDHSPIGGKVASLLAKIAVLFQKL
jgi:hypothetical protein